MIAITVILYLLAASLVSGLALRVVEVQRPHWSRQKKVIFIAGAGAFWPLVCFIAAGYEIARRIR